LNPRVRLATWAYKNKDEAAMLKQASVFAFLLFAANVADAGIFKWVDQNGVTHYSETAPVGQQAQEMPDRPAPSPGNSENSGRPDTMMQQLESAETARKARNEAAEKETAAREAAAKHYRCSQAKRRLYILQQQVPVYSLDANHERVYMDDDTRAAKIKQLNEVAAASCE
jgi:hypothetical protein